MRPEIRHLLGEVCSACDEIVEYAGPGGERYLDSRRDALAVERLLEIIGEAFVRIRDQDPEVFAEITDGHAIIGMRNVIAHGYDVVDPQRIVQVICERIPALRTEAHDLAEG